MPFGFLHTSFSFFNNEFCLLNFGFFFILLFLLSISHLDIFFCQILSFLWLTLFLTRSDLRHLYPPLPLLLYPLQPLPPPLEVFLFFLAFSPRRNFLSSVHSLGLKRSWENARSKS